MKVIEKGKKIAAHLLEASAGDIAFGEGIFHRRWHRPPRHVARGRACRPHPDQLSAPTWSSGCRTARSMIRRNFAWSNGAHACEVEVDRDTGEIHILGYWGVDDIGTVINPMIVEGQIQGGIAQGLGQALREHCYLRSGTGSCYPAHLWIMRCRVRATCRDIISELDESQPCTHNPLGAKGCGEAGSIGAPTAIVGAVLDALRPLGVTDIEMPLTAERVWMAIQFAAAQDRTLAR